MKATLNQYCFRVLGSGEQIELEMSFEELMERQRHGRIVLPDGREAIRDFERERAGEQIYHDGSSLSRGDHWRKHTSVSMACHPSQVAQMREQAKRAGLTGVDYEKNGRVRISTRGQLKKFCRALGVKNLDGGYGDG